MKKIREYYEPELVDALTCILMEENYEIILEKMLALNIDMVKIRKSKLNNYSSFYKFIINI